MCRIHPQTPSSSSSLSSCKPECFTIWMKSLVFNTPGCTVYNSKGEIVYRVDNYDINNKCGQEVYLMDIQGNVLFSLLQKKLRFFGCWDGYKWINDCSNSDKQERCLWFRVRKHRSIYVDLCDDHDTEQLIRCRRYKIVNGKSGAGGFKIVKEEEEVLVAEVKQKETETGIKFGNDVFTLTVQPQYDQTLIMAIVIVYGLINNQI